MPKQSSRPIPDKAEVSIDFPDKFYMGAFTRDSRFEAASEDDGLLIRLVHPGDDKREVAIHLHHLLLADILTSWAKSLAGTSMDESHRRTLLDALGDVTDTLGRQPPTGTARAARQKPGRTRRGKGGSG